MKNFFFLLSCDRTKLLGNFAGAIIFISLKNRKKAKRFLKKHLHPEIFRVGRIGWFTLRGMLELFRISKDLLVYKRLNKSPSVLLCLANPGSVGGTELQVRIIAEHLNDCLVLVNGIVEDGDSNCFLRQLKSKKIPILHLGESPFVSKAAAYLLRWIVPKNAIFHFFNPAATFFAMVLKKGGFRIFYTETGMPKRGGGWENLDQMMIHFDFVTSVSRAGLNSLEQLFGYKGPSRVIPSLIEPFPGRKNCKSGGFHLVYFGRLTLMKGVDLLIRSFVRVLEKFPEAKLSVIGSGELFGSLKALSPSEQIEFTGWVKQDELFSRLSTADLVCLPSETEGLPSAILEAMSMGLPVLATNVGGVAEIVENGVTGILVPPRNEDAFTQALLKLAASPELRDRLGRTAFAKWEERENPIASFMESYGFL